MIESRDEKDLHAALQRALPEIRRRLTLKGFPLYIPGTTKYYMAISCTYRDYEKQNQLYNQGRTTPGQIVTWVRGGGSYHNFLPSPAFDFFRNVKGREWDNSDGFYDIVGKIVMEMGLEWGGSWTKTPDRPHVQLKSTTIPSTAQLRAGATIPDRLLDWEKNKPTEKEEELPVEVTIKVRSLNNYEAIMKGVNFKDYNYIQLREIVGLLGYWVTYDEREKIVIIEPQRKDIYAGNVKISSGVVMPLKLYNDEYAVDLDSVIGLLKQFSGKEVQAEIGNNTLIIREAPKA